MFLPLIGPFYKARVSAMKRALLKTLHAWYCYHWRLHAVMAIQAANRSWKQCRQENNLFCSARHLKPDFRLYDQGRGAAISSAAYQASSWVFVCTLN